MWVEETGIDILGLVHTASEWLSFASKIRLAGEQSFAKSIYQALYDYAVKYNDDELVQLSLEGFHATPAFQATPCQYKKGSAADPNNRPRLKWERNPDADIFDTRLDEGEIIRALNEIEFSGLKDRKYMYVIREVFLELNWLAVTTNIDQKFVRWSARYFQWPWEKARPWRTVETEIRNTKSWEWDETTVPNSDIGKHYAAFSKLLWSTFTDKPKTSENDKPQDKDIFYLPNKIKI